MTFRKILVVLMLLSICIFLATYESPLAVDRPTPDANPGPSASMIADDMNSDIDTISVSIIDDESAVLSRLTGDTVPRSECTCAGKSDCFVKGFYVAADVTEMAFCVFEDGADICCVSGDGSPWVDEEWEKINPRGPDSE